MAVNTTAEDSNAENYQDVDAMGDLLRFLAFSGVGLGLIIYRLILRNRKHWVIMETVLGVMSLLSILFANAIIPNYQTTGVNPLVIYLFRLMAMAKASQSAAIFLTRNSSDQTVGILISVTNILSRVALIMCALHGIYHTTTISQFALKTDVFMTSLLIIGDTFQLSKLTTREGSLTIGDPLSFHMSVDGLMKFMLASWVFGFPEMFLGTVNPGVEPSEGQIALAQVLGCFVFGLAILSFASLCFKNKEDTTNVLKAKLILYVPAALFGLSNSMFYADYRGPGHTILVIGGMTAMAINAGYAVWKYEYENEKLHQS